MSTKRPHLARLSAGALRRALHSESTHTLSGRAPLTPGLAPLTSGALSQARSSLEASRKQLGSSHPATLGAMERVAALLAESSNQEDVSERAVLKHHMASMWRLLNR